MSVWIIKTNRLVSDLPSLWSTCITLSWLVVYNICAIVHVMLKLLSPDFPLKGEGSNAAPASMIPGPGDSTLRKNFFQLQENNRTLTDEEPSRVNKDNNKQGRSG